MKLAGFLSFLFAVASASPLEGRQSLCTDERKIEGVRAEIRTISSHSAADAALIPLALTATQIFIIQPTELGGASLPPVPAGVTGPGTRILLVALATILDANVPGGEFDGANYTVNANGSVTVDFVQTNRFALPRVDVRETHEYNDLTCEITSILGFVRGDLIDPTPLVNEDDPDGLIESFLPLVTDLPGIVGLLPPAA